MKKWKITYLHDLKRYGDSKPEKNVKIFLKRFRKCSFNPTLINKLLFRKIKQKLAIELYSGSNIGKGLYIGHPYGITINANVVIGNNCNIHKGVTIGQENRGKRKGTPVIGDCVWIGVNATVVGKIHIGDDVLIAPNSFVNCDVPSHSVVFGNPCIIKHKDNATGSYINNKIE